MLAALYRQHGTLTWRGLDVLEEPAYSEADPGGYYDATIKARLSRLVRSRLERAEVMLVASRPVWAGVVDSAGDDIHAWGWQHLLDDPMREALICETDTSQFQARTRTTVDRNLSVSVDADGITWAWQDGTAYAAGAFNGACITFPPTNRLRINFQLSRDVAAMTPQAQAGVPISPAVRGEPYSWTTIAIANPGDGTGWAGEITGSGITALQLSLSIPTAYTPIGDKSATAYALKLYACDNAAGTGVVLPQASAVLTDSLDRLPASTLPASAAYRAFVAPDATDLGRVYFEPTSKATDKAAEVVDKTGWRYGWWYRLVGGGWTCVPVYEPRESAPPAYEAIVDGQGVVATLLPTPFAGKARITRATYRDAMTGRTAYADVTDTDITHSPVRLGIDRYDTIGVNTTSAAAATAAAQAHQALVNRDSAPGSVQITVPLRYRGRRILPCEVEAGRFIALHLSDYGSIASRITRVDKLGRSSATLTLEGGPPTAAAAVAKAVRRERRRGRVYPL